MQKVAIIIPCYNEEKRLRQDLLEELVSITTASIYLANDGSSDDTIQMITNFAGLHPNRCQILDYNENQGKAHTIFKSVRHLLVKGYDYIGYFDADFATPPFEIARMLSVVERDGGPDFIFGSRILILNADIRRKWYRHVIGRMILTLINFKFKLGIYDTQCGAKIFSAKVASIAFAEQFYTSWLFDAEIFIRLKQQQLLNLGEEYPLKAWKDVDGSKLGFSTAAKIFSELRMLTKKY